MQRPQEKNSDFAKIREVTGIDDYQRIHKAIQACRNPAGHYEINEVINVLITQETVPDVSAAVRYIVCNNYWWSAMFLCYVNNVW